MYHSWQQAEAKAAAAQERERAVNERLTQTMSRMAVMEAQVCFPKSAFCVADNFNVLKCPCCLVIFKVFCCGDFSLQSHSLSLYKWENPAFMPKSGAITTLSIIGEGETTSIRKSTRVSCCDWSCCHSRRSSQTAWGRNCSNEATIQAWYQGGKSSQRSFGTGPVKHTSLPVSMDFSSRLDDLRRRSFCS